MKRFFTRVRPTDPLLTTRWLDVASGATWLLYMVYGLVTLFSPVPTFIIAGAPPWYSILWSICITLSAATAAFGVLLLFYEGGMVQVKKKRIELYGIWILMGFMLVYEMLLFFLVAHGDSSRLAQIFNVLILLPFPAFRIGHLNRRIRLLQSGARA